VLDAASKSGYLDGMSCYTLRLLPFLVSVFILSACGWLQAPPPKPAPTPRIIQVSADEIALAMQEDHFFADYNGFGLDVKGTVTTVSQEKGHSILELATQIDTKVLCDFGSQQPGVKAGDAVTVRSPDANQAARAPGAVLLANCVMISP
jgi:hypothetical protein